MLNHDQSDQRHGSEAGSQSMAISTVAMGVKARIKKNFNYGMSRTKFITSIQGQKYIGRA